MVIRVALFAGFIFFILQSGNALAFLGLFGRHESVKAQTDEVFLDTADLAAGGSRFYKLEQGGALIKFFVVRDRSSKLHAALDACEVCWGEGKGYEPDKGAMRCVNCGQMFPLQNIGLKKGGCNPHPVTFTPVQDAEQKSVSDKLVSIKVADLLAGAKYFPENAR
jgi:uncharacterized membrane protein